MDRVTLSGGQLSRHINGQLYPACLDIGLGQSNRVLNQFAQIQTTRLETPPLDQAAQTVDYITRPLVVPANVSQNRPEFLQIGLAVLKKHFRRLHVSLNRTE